MDLVIWKKFQSERRGVTDKKTFEMETIWSQFRFNGFCSNQTKNLIGNGIVWNDHFKLKLEQFLMNRNDPEKSPMAFEKNSNYSDVECRNHLICLCKLCTQFVYRHRRAQVRTGSHRKARRRSYEKLHRIPHRKQWETSLRNSIGKSIEKQYKKHSESFTTKLVNFRL